MGRPHTPLLDRDRIADAALRLTDRRGDFTILDLARALKVTPAAIYHHVDGRAEIVTLHAPEDGPHRRRIRVRAAALGPGPAPLGHLLPGDLRRARRRYQMLAAEPVADPVVHARVRTSGHRPGRRGLPPRDGTRRDHRDRELRPRLRARPHRPARHGHRHRRQRHPPARRGGQPPRPPAAPAPTRPSTSAWTPSSPACATRSARLTMLTPGTAATATSRPCASKTSGTTTAGPRLPKRTADVRNAGCR